VSARRVPPDERTLVWRSFDAFNRRDPDALLELYNEDCVWSLESFGGWPDDQEYRGHDGLRRRADDFLGAWGEFRITATGLWHLGGRVGSSAPT
jgi:ketosteroid isomerase-like protein